MTLFKSVLNGVALTGAMALLSTGALAGGLKDDAGRRPFSWTGFYAGVNAGSAWGDADLKSTAACPDGSGCAYLASQPGNLETIGRLGSGSISEDGFTGGVQVGYNQQRGNTVFGLELDFNSVDLGGVRAAAAVLPSGDGQVAAVGAGFSMDWLLTLRGRVGVTISPTVLAYVTGGLAISEVEVANAYLDNHPLESISGASGRSETKVGWTVGGGLEWAINNNWTIKGEYLYVDLGSISTKADFLPPSQAGLLTPNTLNTSVDLTTHIARGGINYKF